MHKLISRILVAITFVAVAGLALAQNADKNSAGPTKNDLKIRVTEPMEGATITGTTAKVVIDYDRARYREQGATDKGLDKFPPPNFDVFLDNTLKENLKGINVATLVDIPPGAHKIVILAKNLSGEVIDRKEVNITTVSAMATTTTTTETTERMTAPPPPPAPAPETRTYEAPPPAPAAPVESTLPATASNAPSLALAGLLLAGSGLLVARKVS